MKLNVITGRNGSGKTQMLLEQLHQFEDNLVITNDQAVFYIEMYMAKNQIPGKCVGLSSLSSFFSKELFLGKNESTKEGLIAILSKIMIEHSSEFKLFKNIHYTDNLIDKIYALIIECKEDNLLPTDLYKKNNRIPIELENKLYDISLIYQYFNEELHRLQLFPKEDILLKTIEKLKAIEKFPYKYVFIDSLDRYNLNIKEIIRLLLEKTEELTAAFATTSNKAYDYEIHIESIKALYEIIEHAEKIPYCKISKNDIKTQSNINNGLSIIEKEMFNRDTNTISNADNVCLYEAMTIYDEINFITKKIVELVKYGVNLDDITVTASSMNRYISSMNDIFSKNNIPFYYYKNDPVSKTFLFEFLSIVLNSVEKELNVENILKLAHINYTGLTLEEITILDSFFNRFGKDLKTAIKNGELFDPNSISKILFIIQKIKEPIDVLKKNMLQASSNTELLNYIYNYLKDIKIFQSLVKETNEARENNLLHASSELKAAWNSIMSIFEQMNHIFSTLLSIHDFNLIFEKMCNEKPSRNENQYHDQVLVLDLNNARNKKSKILFVLGCNEGYMPEPLPEPLVNDYDKKIIKFEFNTELRTSDVFLKYKKAAIYSIFTLPQDKLFLSWTLNDFDGKTLVPAFIMSNILKTFASNILQTDNSFSNQEESFKNLLFMLSEEKNKKIKNPNLDSYFLYFKSHPNYKKRLQVALDFLNKDTTVFESSHILETYKESTKFSVTRIEAFNMCPMKHFIQHGLSPQRTKVFEETPADKGIFYHEIFKKFFNHIIEKNIDLKTLEYETYSKIVTVMISDTMTNHNENIFSTTPKFVYESNKIKQTIKDSVWNSILQINKGDFSPYKNEFYIGEDKTFDIILKNGEKASLVGVIDRIDKLKDSDHLRIIDYKSGNKIFSVEEILAGIQLQLPIYGKIMQEMDYKIAGLYFFHIQKPILNSDKQEFDVLKKYQLSGPTLNESEILVATDHLLSSGGQTSSVIAAGTTADGTITKISKVMTEQEMQNIIDSSSLVLTSSIENILSGETKAYPLKHKETIDACKYCQYQSICGIDFTKPNATRKIMSSETTEENE